VQKCSDAQGNGITLGYASLPISSIDEGEKHWHWKYVKTSVDKKQISKK